jgi:hypothetical protein
MGKLKRILVGVDHQLIASYLSTFMFTMLSRCRVIQKALESLDYDDLCELLEEFKQNVLVCIQDQNGNHVMQKCIEVISIKAKEAEFQSGQAGVAVTMAKNIQFIVDDVLANVESLCCHPYGCRVLQRMLEHCVEIQKMATLDKIQLCHKTLMDDQYGNYVIQHVLQYGRDIDRDSLLKIVVENDLLKLSRQKFASNVVEKLLKYGNSYQRNAIVREMLKVFIICLFHCVSSSLLDTNCLLPLIL